MFIKFLLSLFYQYTYERLAVKWERHLLLPPRSVLLVWWEIITFLYSWRLTKIVQLRFKFTACKCSKPCLLLEVKSRLSTYADVTNCYTFQSYFKHFFLFFLISTRFLKPNTQHDQEVLLMKVCKSKVTLCFGGRTRGQNLSSLFPYPALPAQVHLAHISSHFVVI